MDGGGGRLSGGDYVLNGTLGQPDAGLLAGGDFMLIGGFWGLAATGPVVGAYHVCLPLVLRND